MKILRPFLYFLSQSFLRKRYVGMHSRLLDLTQELAEASRLLEHWKEGEAYLAELLDEGVTPDLVYATLRTVAALQATVMGWILDAESKAFLEDSRLEFFPPATSRLARDNAWTPDRGVLRLTGAFEVAVLLGVTNEAGQWMWDAMCALFREWNTLHLEVLFDGLDIMDGYIGLKDT